MYCPSCGHATVQRFIDGRNRDVCPACGAVHWLDPKVAVAVIIARDGKVLLGKRGPAAERSGNWAIPAGFVDRGERVEDAAIREMREETGLAIVPGHLLTAISETGNPVIVLVYVAQSFTGMPTPGDDLTDLGWFDPDELPELSFAHDRDILCLWKSGQHGS